MKQDWCAEYYTECASYLGLDPGFCAIHTQEKDTDWSHPMDEELLSENTPKK